MSTPEAADVVEPLPASREPWLARLLDGVGDWAVVGFAVWTLLTYLVTALDLPVEPFLIAWFVLLVPSAWLVVRLRRTSARMSARTDSRPTTDEPPAAVSPAAVATGFAVTAALAVVAAVVAAYGHGAHWYVAALPAFAALVTSVVLLLRPWPWRVRWPLSRAGETTVPASLLGHWIAAAAAVGSGVVSIFVYRLSLDDVYYVNRAAAVADLDRIPAHDVILSQNHLDPIGGTGAPVDALGPLQGALAHLLGVHGATVAYYLTPPVGTFLAVWALWRLARRWSPWRPEAVFGVALLFLYLDGSGMLSFGNFFLTRMWQGKVPFVAWLVPTLLCYLTDWMRRAGWPTAVLLVAAGVTSLGLTVSATYVVPLLAVAAAFPLVLARRFRLALVPLGAAVFPLAAGAYASHLAPPGAGQLHNFRIAPVAYADVFGTGAAALVGAAALWLGLWLVRDRLVRVMLLVLSAVVLVLMTRGVLSGLHHLLSIGGALRRVFWVAPVPVLVGLLAVALVPRPGRVPAAVRWVGPLALVVVICVVGSPITSYDGAHFVAKPTWRFPAVFRSQAKEILAHVDHGVVLAPVWTSSAIAITTARVKTVDPRTYYTKLIPQPSWMLNDRMLLDRFQMRGPAYVDHAAVKRALVRLDVGTACVWAVMEGAQSFLEQTGYRHAFDPPQLRCYVRAANT